MSNIEHKAQQIIFQGSLSDTFFPKLKGLNLILNYIILFKIAYDFSLNLA